MTHEHVTAAVPCVNCTAPLNMETHILILLLCDGQRHLIKSKKSCYILYLFGHLDTVSKVRGRFKPEM